MHWGIILNYSEIEHFSTASIEIATGAEQTGTLSLPISTGGAKLAIPMQNISLYRICAAVDPKAIDKMISVHSSPSSFCPVGRNIRAVLDRTYDTLKDDLISSMKSITIEKIVNDYHTILEMGK